MAKIGVEILGRHLGVAMSSDEKTYQAFTVYAFHPAPGVNLPELCDLVIDCAHGWVIPIRGDGAGDARRIQPVENGEQEIGEAVEAEDSAEKGGPAEREDDIVGVTPVVPREPDLEGGGLADAHAHGSLGEGILHASGLISVAPVASRPG